MNIIKESARNLKEAFMHYVCMRLRFRSSVWSEETHREVCDVVVPGSCHCCPTA